MSGDTSLLENTNEKGEAKDEDMSTEVREENEEESLSAAAVQENKQKATTEHSEQANGIAELIEETINETSESAPTWEPEEPEEHGQKSTIETKDDVDTTPEILSTIDTPGSRESVVEPNKETEEKRNSIIKSEEDKEGEVTEEQKHAEDKTDEELPDNTSIEKQDAEEVKEENERSEGPPHSELSLGELELLVEEENDDETISFQLEQDRIEGKQAEQSEASTITEAAIVPEKKNKKRSKKSYKPIHRDTIETIRLEPPRQTISGDFVPLGSRKPSLTIESYYSIESYEVEEEESDDEESSELSLLEYTREEYYEMYNDLDKQCHDEKLKNAYLVKNLVNYYTQRKVLHVMHDDKSHLDILRKYEKQLDDFERLTNVRMIEQMNLAEELCDLNTKFAQKEIEAQACFENFQRDEYEIGKEIINSQSATSHEEKVIDRYLKRQKTQMNLLKKIRLNYIKIRNKVTETQAALDALDNLGPNLRLIDYEQLKFDNINLLDKLEERDLEITKVRLKCENAVQILAHRREKASALEGDICAMTDMLANLTGEHEDVREQLNTLKHDRDLYRNATNKTKKEAGLLSKPKLLRNMCETIDERVSLAHQLETIRKECNTITNKVKKLRKNMSSERRLKAIQSKMKLDETLSNPRNALTISSLDTDLIIEQDKSNL